MKNKLLKPLSPFVIFGIALSILALWVFLELKFDWDFLMLVDILVVFLFFWLILEAAAQANPSQVESPLNKFLAKYSNRRDRLVIVVSSIAVLVVLSMASLFNVNPLLTIVLSIIGAVVVYYGICLLFGTRELRDQVVPNFIKQIVFHKNSADE